MHTQHVHLLHTYTHIQKIIFIHKTHYTQELTHTIHKNPLIHLTLLCIVIASANVTIKNMVINDTFEPSHFYSWYNKFIMYFKMILPYYVYIHSYAHTTRTHCHIHMYAYKQ